MVFQQTVRTTVARESQVKSTTPKSIAPEYICIARRVSQGPPGDRVRLVTVALVITFGGRLAGPALGERMGGEGSS